MQWLRFQRKRTLSYIDTLPASRLSHLTSRFNALRLDIDSRIASKTGSPSRPVFSNCFPVRRVKSKLFAGVELSNRRCIHSAAQHGNQNTQVVRGREEENVNRTSDISTVYLSLQFDNPNFDGGDLTDNHYEMLGNTPVSHEQ